jgi:hypothetical protein
VLHCTHILLQQHVNVFKDVVAELCHLKQPHLALCDVVFNRATAASSSSSACTDREDRFVRHATAMSVNTTTAVHSTRCRQYSSAVLLLCRQCGCNTTVLQRLNNGCSQLLTVSEVALSKACCMGCHSALKKSVIGIANWLSTVSSGNLRLHSACAHI